MTATAKIEKVIFPGVNSHGDNVFCKIKFKDGKLSITGVEGPKRNGDANGSCGQIAMGYFHRNPAHNDSRYSNPTRIVTFQQGWSEKLWLDFLEVWNDWHLNDMVAGSPSQEAFLEANPIPAGTLDHYSVACARLKDAGLNPDANGYLYGHALNRVEVPEDILAFILALPATTIAPAWV